LIELDAILNESFRIFETIFVAGDDGDPCPAARKQGRQGQSKPTRAACDQYVPSDTGTVYSSTQARGNINQMLQQTIPVECKHYLLRVVKVACRHRRIKNQAVCHIAIDKKKRTMMDRTMRSSTKSRNMMQPAAPRNRVELDTALREHSNK